MNVQHISIEDYTYDLPNEKIALFPIEQRDQSKLLIWKDEAIQEDIYLNIAHWLPENALMVFNNTKVIHARLLFQKSTGATIEIFILEPYNISMQDAMEAKQSLVIKCFIGGVGKWTKNLVLEKVFEREVMSIKLEAQIVGKESDYFLVQLNWNTTDRFSDVIEMMGNVPLPPYIKRTVKDTDHTRYQTIYAKHEGSVAAPTAGLHFTEKVFESLQQKGIIVDYITLHVGAGTFKPVSAATMQTHAMHYEYIELDLPFLNRLLQVKNQVIAVGTTSMRTLETIYWLGVKTFYEPTIKAEQLHLHQWDAYQLCPIKQHDALVSLINWMEANEITAFTTTTQLLIAPGYQFKIVNWLVTNFHQPKSTLLLLVAAAVGDDWRKIYDFALHNDYRFLSYGDGCLLKLK